MSKGVSTRTDRFVENDPKAIILGKSNKVYAIFPVTPRLWDYTTEQMQKLRMDECGKNSVFMSAWEAAQLKFTNVSSAEKVQLRHTFPQDEFIIAALSYSLENPPMYRDFNTRTREHTPLAPFNYKSLFYLLTEAAKSSTLKLNFSFSTLYKGASVRYDAVAGQYVNFRNFTSTTVNKSVAMYFLKNPTSSTLFKILDVDVGLPMENVSDFPHEQEVLLLPYDLYKVEKVESVDGLRVITLRSQHMSVKEGLGNAPF